jgi:plastocyanin
LHRKDETFLCKRAGARAANPMSKVAIPFVVLMVLGLLASPAMAANTTIGVKESGCSDGRTFCFDKDTFDIEAGETVTLNNNGATAHSFCITGVAGGDLCTPNPSGGTPAGATSTVTIPASTAPGTYAYKCNVPGHDALGMKGNVTLEAAMMNNNTGNTGNNPPPAKSPGFEVVAAIGALGLLALAARRKD